MSSITFNQQTKLEYRNIQFFGLDSQQKVTSSYVVVIGLGGVGSHAASMLLRSGVGKLLLVGFDQCQVDAEVLLYDVSSEEEILSGNPDFVLDCIDNIDIKVRHRLRKDHGIEGGIPVVFSLEKPKAQLLPFRGPSGEEDNPLDYQVRMLASYFCSFKVLCLIT
uniref:THIF-type NAD/FAD binding fold domain-containing protein n=1 Tax=Gossypium raimondii TaxID=29730 RepID=A0A0D2VES4_GOSRA|nr:hypothetical protein B456_013G132900 [Gossypium raimondii]